MPLNMISPQRFIKRPDSMPQVPTNKLAAGATAALTVSGDIPGKGCAKSKANIHFRIHVDARVDDAAKPDERCYVVYDQTWYATGTTWKPYTVGEGDPGFETAFNTAGLKASDLELVATTRAVSADDPYSGELTFSLKSKTKPILYSFYIEGLKVPANAAGMLE